MNKRFFAVRAFIYALALIALLSGSHYVYADEPADLYEVADTYDVANAYDTAETYETADIYDAADVYVSEPSDTYISESADAYEAANAYDAADAYAVYLHDAPRADINYQGGDVSERGFGPASGVVFAPSPAVFVPQAVPTVRYRDAGEVIDAVRAYPHSGFIGSKTTRYADTPKISPPTYDAASVGSIHPDDLLDALNTIKMVRFLAGVPYRNVTLADELNKYSQYGAYFMAVHNMIEHYPPKPAAMPSDFYNIAYKGCSEANITAGFPNLSASIMAQVGDLGKNNIELAGHRRWLLKPGGERFGVGYVRGNPSADAYGGYKSSVYVFDGPGPGDCEADSYVAWPSPGSFPIQYFVNGMDIHNDKNVHGLYPWSINLGAEYLQPQRSEIRLTLTRTRLGAVINKWVFNSSTPKLSESSNDLTGMHLAVDSAYVGMQKAIIFKPDSDTLGTIRNGDSFNVYIEGLRSNKPGNVGNPVTLSYDVNFFDLQSEISRSTISYNVMHLGVPVEGAVISAGGASAVTDANGKAKLRFDNNRSINYTISKAGYETEAGVVYLGAESIEKRVDMVKSVVFTLTGINRVYSGRAQGGTVGASADVPYTITYNGSADLPIGAGTYKVIVQTASEGYKGRAEATLAIAPAPLTVWADDIVATYGERLPAINAKFEGLVGRDTADASSIKVSYRIGEPNAPNGRYAAGIYGGAIMASAADYAVTVLESKLIISKKPVTVTGLTAYDREYSPGGVEAVISAFNAAVNGVLDGDDVVLDISEAKGLFESDSIGEKKAVLISGISLAGAQCGNYVLPAAASYKVTASIKARLAAGDVAASFGSACVLQKDTRTFALPVVPAGFAVFIAESGNHGVILPDGTVFPVAQNTVVSIRLGVRRIERADADDGDPDNYAVSNPIAVTVPAFTKYNIEAVATYAASGGDIRARVTGGGVYFINDAVSLSAEALSNDIIFEGWYEDGARISGAGATYVFTALSDRRLEARFVKRAVTAPPPQGGPSGSVGSPGANVEMPTPGPRATPSPSPSPTPKAAPTPKPVRAKTAARKSGGVTGNTKVTAAAPAMTDIPADFWAYRQIGKLARLGVISGYPAEGGGRYYAPERLITRAEFMKLISVSLNLPTAYDFDGSGFADWDEVDEWAKPYAASLIKAGIIKGSYEGGALRINPKNDISREEAAVIAFRSMVAGAGDTDAGFESKTASIYPDDIGDIQDWALIEIRYLFEKGLINVRGYDGEPYMAAIIESGGTPAKCLFMPSAPTRRDEAAVLICGLLENAG